MPMWILMNVLTLGNVSHLFTIQKKEVQIDMIKNLKINNNPYISSDIDIINVSRIFQILSLFRNICAHNERFYLTKIKTPIDDVYLGFGSKLPYYVNPKSKKKLNFSQRKKRLNARQGIYSLIFILSLFMDKQQLNNLLREIKLEFKLLEKNLYTIGVRDIERIMGMNFNWHELIKTSKNN